MTTVAVILAGGRGTRSADPLVPKIAQVVGGRSLLSWHLELLNASEIKKVLIVTAHLSQQVEQLCTELDFPKLQIELIRETDPQGTVIALTHAAQTCDASQYLVILGDILMSLPVDDFIQQWEISGKHAGVVVHPSTHPNDSDSVFTRFDGSVLFSPKGSLPEQAPNMSSAGLFALNGIALARYAGCTDIGSELLAIAADEDQLFVFESSHYLKDTGTPERLELARHTVSSGSFARRGATTPRPAILIDRDGVLNPQYPEVYEAENYSLVSGVTTALRAANQMGVPVIVVTNQPGIAKGLMSFAEHEKIRGEFDRQLGASQAFVDDYLFCPHHPESGFVGEVERLKVECDCRKPAPGMAITAGRKHRLDLERSIVIGDTDRDFDLAKAIKASFKHVTDCCEITEVHSCFRSAVEAIDSAVEDLTC